MQNKYSKGIVMSDILENNDKMLVAYKSQGESMQDFIARVKAEDEKLAPIYDLDDVAGGIVVFAKDKQTYKTLADFYKNGEFSLEFLAVIVGKPQKERDMYSAYIAYDKVEHKLGHVPMLNAGAEHIALDYVVLSSVQNISLVSVKAREYRRGSVRFMLADLGTPVFGDKVYKGDTLAKNTHTALILHSVGFPDIAGDGHRTFKAMPQEGKPWTYFDIERLVKVY